MIRLAKKEDLDIIMKEIQKVKEEMHESGNPQWGNTPEEYPSKEDFLEDIANNSLYVFEEDDKIKGLVCIKEDTEYEYDSYIQNSHERAFVLHRMAVFLDYRGEHISQKFFEYADDLAKENHISLLKADTEVQNQKMNAILKRLQYEFKGEFTPNYPGKYNYYEKRIEVNK